MRLRLKYWLVHFLLLTSSTVFCNMQNYNSEPSDYDCTSDADCNAETKFSAGNCGVCVDTKTTKSKCLYPFPYMYKTNDKNCTVSTPCSLTCQNNGTCTQTKNNPLVYPPYCKCNEMFYGDECQLSVSDPEDRITFITWIFEGFIPVGRLNILTIVIIHILRFTAIYNIYHFYVTTIEGYTGYQTSDNRIFKGCYFKSPECFGLKLNIRFPYKIYDQSNKTEFINHKDEVVGYRSSFTLTVSHKNQQLYKRSFPIVVYYMNEMLKCVPIIKLINCLENSFKPTTYTRASTINLISKVEFVDNGKYISKSLVSENCTNSANFIWKMWNFVGAQESDEPLFQNYTKHNWLFDPYSLGVGTYKVMLEVQNVQIKDISTNIACCSIKVKYLPLIAVIDGGSDRMVYKQTGIKLSAVQSRDPNMPMSQQSGLYVQWSCKRIQPPSDNDPMCAPTTTEYNEPYYIKPDLLTYSGVYNFTLMLFSRIYIDCEDESCPKPLYAYARIEVGNKTLEGSISVECLQNCGEKVVASQQLFLKVTSDSKNNTHSFSYEWTFHKTYKENEKSIDAIKVEGLPPFMLLVREDSFETGQEYTVAVRLFPHGGYAKYSFTTDKEEQEPNCTVDPAAGIKGLTLFDIVCISIEDSTFLYEFYDKTVEDSKRKTISSGRMLGSSNTGQLIGVQLAKGVVTIYLINPRGFHIKKEVIVNLEKWNVSEEIMADIKKNVSDALSFPRDEQRSLRIISLIPYIIPPEANKQEILNYLLTNMHGISTDTLPMVKLTISTLYNVLTELNSPSLLELQPNLMVDTLGIIKKQSEALKRFLSGSEQSLFLPQTEVKIIIQYILQCFYEALRCRANNTSQVDLDDISLQELITLELGSRYLEDIFDHLKDALSYVQSPGMPPTRISSDDDHIVVWALANEKDYPFTNYLKHDIPVAVSPQLLQSVDSKQTSNTDVITLQIAKVNDNIFWWLKSDVKSNLVSASIAIRMEEEDKSVTKLRHVNSLRYPIGVRIKAEQKIFNININGSVKQLDSHWDQDILDLNVQIHRFDVVPRSLVTIMFIFPPTNGSLRVLLLEDFRPDYKIMMTDSITVSEKSPMCPHHYHEYDEPRYLYMGILPVSDIPINQTVEYAFEMNTILCQFWNRGSWSSEGCLVVKDTKDNEVICQCNHLSIFAAAFPIPPQRIDPFGDAKLFLTVIDNPLVVSFVSVMLLIYTLLIILLWYKDTKDKTKRAVILLEDNFPLDKHPYLLAVFTSARFYAGTSANVGIKIFGSAANSRTHVLSSSTRKVLKTGSDDWFLIYCPEHLGKVTGIHLWIDNGGISPSWFCTRIFVYDLKDKTETKFIVDEWLSLDYIRRRKNKCYPEALIKPTDEEDISGIKRGLLENLVIGIRDTHMVLSLFYRHPRSQVSRVQRLSIIMFCIMVAMLCSIMFYKPDDESLGTDDYRYSVGMREVIVSLQSLVISVVLTGLILFAFRKSYKWRYNRRETIGGASETVSNYQQSTGTAYNTFVRFVATALKHPPLSPIQVRGSPPVVTKRKLWFAISWIICFSVIFVSTYFVMLYGLKLGLVNSKKWLSSVVLTLGEDTLITGPARILIFSILLSLAFQVSIEVKTYHINAQKVKLKRASSWDTYDMEKLMDTRSKRTYAPLTDYFREEIIRKKEMQSYWWLILDFLTAAINVFIICNVNFQLWTSHYYMNSHVQTMLTNTHVPLLHSVPFDIIRNISSFEDYLDSNFLHTVYRTRWYNHHMFDNVESGYWTADFTNRLVGRPMVRQLRVRPIPCGNIVMRNKMCAPRWDEEYEDTDPYAKGWKPGSHFDVNRENSPWLYTEKTTPFMTTFVRLYGSSGRLFHNGGYSVTLGPKRKDVDQMLEELSSKKWQDSKTRVVFVELTTFNANYGLFSQVTLVVEYMVSGTVLLKSQAISLDNTFELNVWDVMFVVFIVFYIMRSLYLINFLGLLEYLAGGLNNICRLIVIVFGLLAVVLFCTHFYTSSLIAEQFQRSHVDEYFDYDSFSLHFVLLQTTLSFLLCVAIVRLIASIRGGTSLQIHIHTFRMSLKWTFWIGLILLLFILLLKQFTYLLNIFTSYGSKEITVNHNSMRYLMNEDFEYRHVKIFLIFKMICILFINTIFIVVFVNCARLSKAYRFSASERFNFITFLISRVTGKKYSIIVSS